jgi:hypothetical protein
MTSPKTVPREQDYRRYVIPIDDSVNERQLCELLRERGICYWVRNAAPEAAPAPADDTAGLIARLRDRTKYRKMHGLCGWVLALESFHHEAAAALEAVAERLAVAETCKHQREVDAIERAEAAEAEVVRLTKEIADGEESDRDMVKTMENYDATITRLTARLAAAVGLLGESVADPIQTAPWLGNRIRAFLAAIRAQAGE